jgi:hypothetical protein
MEEYGHSLIYIKEAELRLFYDPNYGLTSFDQSESATLLWNGINKCFQLFKTNKLNFYRMQPDVCLERDSA